MSTFPTLSSDNAGTVIYLADYAHWIAWDGTTASLADGDNGYIGMFISDPLGPGWHLADSSTVESAQPERHADLGHAAEPHHRHLS